MMTNLLPCPFCGGEPYMTQNYLGQKLVRCPDCGATEGGTDTDDWRSDKLGERLAAKMAADAWNRRVKNLFGGEADDVAAWMPLPDPYKEDEALTNRQKLENMKSEELAHRLGAIGKDECICPISYLGPANYECGIMTDCEKCVLLWLEGVADDDG